MHLLEACIAWIPYDRTRTFERLSVEIIDLLAARFLIPECGAILEYFNEDWSPPPNELSGCVEPGHLYEWYWLLNAFEEATGNRVSAGARIYNFADQFGSNKDSGLLFDYRDLRRKALPDLSGIKMMFSCVSLQNSSIACFAPGHHILE
jgi:mannose/cellobiose epimerase-like protein (N-acyl-D-glucosamine 2-epimerase family)